MKISTFFISIFCLLVLSSCQTPLDRNYFPGRFEEDTKDILINEAATDHEMFLINYAIVKHRDHSNYEIKNQSFASILDQAKKFESTGMGVVYEFDGKVDEKGLSSKLKNEGIGNKRVGNTSVLRKGLLFSCVYENNTDSDIFLEKSNFQVFGPFQDHLTSLCYQINYYIKKGEKKKINFFADGQNIQNNIKFGMAPTVRTTRIDEVMMLSSIQNVGNKFYPKTFKDVNLNPEEGRFQAIKAFSYEKDLKGKDWIQKTDGQTVIKLGKLDVCEIN